MLIFDQLKKNDPALRLLAVVVFGGLALLLVGLWWVQVVSGRYYEAKLEKQSFRTVRVPAPRGGIFDRNHTPLAENDPAYNLSLYLEDLSPEFQHAYNAALAAYNQAKVKLNRAQRAELARVTRYAVASNVVANIGGGLQQSLQLDPGQFQKHFEQDLALPLPVLANLDSRQVARVTEQADLPRGLDLDIQPVRNYPYGSAAVHLLGYVRPNTDSVEGEESFYNHRLPDFRGVVGVEAAFDGELRGSAGEKEVLVNNLGYRQSENILTPAEPGENVVLTIDLPIQQAAEKALRIYGTDTRGAAVVLDVSSGDILAMASSPAFDPNELVRGISHERWEQLSDERLRPQINRCTQENYAPGSIFKMVVAMAALENGWNPAEVVHAQPNPARPGHSIFYVGRRSIRDTAPPGDYNFKKAFIYSSNSYFITSGLRTGIRKIVAIGKKLHLGERTGLTTRQEVAGYFPNQKRVSLGWSDGNTANTCIGQDPVLVTPLQVAVMTAAVANGGKVLWPRIVDRIEPQNPASNETATNFPSGVIRDELGVSKRSLDILRDAMLADTEEAGGSAYPAFQEYYRNGGKLRVCGKTGTAEVQNEHGDDTDSTTWFASYAPFENPRYAVVVMVESGRSGGGTCAPIARDIYLALQTHEQQLNRPKATTLARAE